MPNAFVSDHARPDANAGDREWLHLLVGDWQIVADLAFADLILWLPAEGGGVLAQAHARPSTAHTRFPSDIVGEPPGDEAELIAAALATGETQTGAGVVAVPMRRTAGALAVVTVHRSPALGEPGELEHAYQDAADVLLEMGRLGLWPDSSTATGSRRGAPRVGDGFLRLNKDGTVAYASPNAVSAFRRLGIIGQIVGHPLTALTRDIGLAHKLADESLPLVLNGRMPWRSEITADRSTLTLRAIPLRSLEGRTGAILLCRDVSELRRREQELVSKDATIREIHHRVKNNLQTVAALLRIQSRRMQSEEAKEGLAQAMRRVDTIARVHEALSHGLAQSVDFDALIQRQFHLAAEIASSEQHIETILEGRFGYLPSDAATPLALVINELVANAVEHGFAGRQHGWVRLTARRTPSEKGPERLEVLVEDDGLGYAGGGSGGSAAASGASAGGAGGASAGAAHTDRTVQAGLGTKIVETLVTSELGGTITWGARHGGGTVVTIELLLRPSA
ncbi:sensor histidine kinase [Falsarthrobacter nasiphocae]|uniref:histidine kinase n=1 Tax=Falsarthrobacter nasiphocae TaxID=189863 RepID=A0AAE3YGB9_9MICC|nr:histidine kinase N-terminal domain-containing protein [Falsarthrobacter nasiphocae]MDR6891418.1 two-component sensor histidine kinase [Falsarthrobacter nasiphocae]